LNFQVNLIIDSKIIQGNVYFDARAESNRSMEPRVAQNGGDYTVYSKTTPIVLGRRMEHYAFEFEMTDPTDYQARVVLNCGTSDIDCWFDNVKVSEIVESKVKDKPIKNPTGFKLYPNYPNPFNDATTLSFYLAESSRITIQIYNIRGELVQTLMDKPHQSGHHRMVFEADNKATGLYFYTISAQALHSDQHDQKTGKMLLVR